MWAAADCTVPWPWSLLWILLLKHIEEYVTCSWLYFDSTVPWTWSPLRILTFRRSEEYSLGVDCTVPWPWSLLWILLLKHIEECDLLMTALWLYRAVNVIATTDTPIQTQWKIFTGCWLYRTVRIVWIGPGAVMLPSSIRKTNLEFAVVVK